METQPLREETLRASRQAAEWLSTLEDASLEERQAFVEWLGRSSLHVQEFLVLSALDRYLDHVPGDYAIDIAKLRQTGAERIVPFTATKQSIPARKQWRVWTAAATLAFVVLTALWSWHASSWHSYSTGIGEQRAVELQDGSLIHLNARSEVEIRFSKQARDIRLRSGEALFKVKSDTHRSFKVHAGDTTILAIGTQFNVYRRASGTAVAVVEGKVLLSRDETSKQTKPQYLGAGEEAQVAPSGWVAVHKDADVARATAWRQRQLIFDANPLPEIAAEFNRYNRSPQLRVDGATASQRRFTGVFDADDPESLIALLAKDVQLQIEQSGEEIVIRGRTNGRSNF